jgi:N-acetylglucosaminyl-diphospho-decaprenol L-rhamnosyltransferase
MASSSPARRWTFVTVAYNSAGDLARNWSADRLDGARWVVVDNSSSDDSVRVATDRGAHVLACDRNHGFGRANNLGLELVDTDFVAFANPDVLVDPTTLPGLSALLDVHDAIVGPQLRNRDGSLQSGARGLPFLVDKLAHRGIRLPGARLDDYLVGAGGDAALVPAAWLMGAAITARTETMRRLGGWSEDYFLYYEDHELGLRAWREGVPVLLSARDSWVHDWARATMKPSVAAWRHEVVSAWTFYRHFPELLLPLRRRAWRRHTGLGAATGHGSDA